MLFVCGITQCLFAVQVSGEGVAAGPERGDTEWLNGLPVTGVSRQVFCHEPGDN